jgi:hypothetical protein
MIRTEDVQLTDNNLKNSTKMKKFITLLVLVLIVSMTSCSKHTNILLYPTGKVVNVYDYDRLISEGDTIIVEAFTSSVRNTVDYELYGKFIGTVPDTLKFHYMFKGDSIFVTVNYYKGVRIK